MTDLRCLIPTALMALIMVPVILVPAMLGGADGDNRRVDIDRDNNVSSWYRTGVETVESPVPVPTLAPVLEVQEPQRITTYITFYACPPFCGTMYNGEQVYEGAAACGRAFELGTVLLIQGDPLGPVVCKDRGHGGHYWVDRFFENAGEFDGSEPGTGWWWQRQVGVRGTVEVVN